MIVYNKQDKVVYFWAKVRLWSSLLKNIFGSGSQKEFYLWEWKEIVHPFQFHFSISVRNALMPPLIGYDSYHPFKKLSNNKKSLNYQFKNSITPQLCPPWNHTTIKIVMMQLFYVPEKEKKKWLLPMLEHNAFCNSELLLHTYWKDSE